MLGSAFQTNPINLCRLLDACHSGSIQLPDFQRSWVWDEDRIKSLIASVSKAFPIGALMSLETGGPVDFKPRPIEGAPESARDAQPQSLLLDGQQRMTSLYQVALRGQVVETINAKKKKVRRWFYIDIRKALDDSADREDAIIGVPEGRIERRDFGREIMLDLSTPEKEYAALMYPVSQVFDCGDWQDGYNDYWDFNKPVKDEFRKFKHQILETFKSYHVPVITLGRSTPKEAVCVVFEKVNTGGKPLDAFELVTAMYAASGHELRKDWFGGGGATGRHHRFANTLPTTNSEPAVLANVSNTDFLQAASLFHTRERRRTAEAAGKQGKELPPVSCNRHALLDLPLEAYKKFESAVEGGFVRSAKFLHMLHIYRAFDLPYQSQVVPLPAILADIGDAWEYESVRRKLVQWYWNGVFGELYGSAAETRIARDFVEVTNWLRGGPEPSTVTETLFRADRLKTMRTRLSAAYKGMNALLMQKGARDLRSGQEFGYAAFFGEHVDVHHIFPQDWCKARGIKAAVFDSIINKTPLSSRTNRIIGGAAPSQYLAKLEKGGDDAPPISEQSLDRHLVSHLIEPALLRADRFDAFMTDRQTKLLALIEEAIGKSAYAGTAAEEGDDADVDEDTAEASLTLPAL